MFDPHSTTMGDLFKAMAMILDVWMEEDEALSVTGVVMVEDMKSLSLAHLASITPVDVKRMTTLFQVYWCLLSYLWHYESHSLVTGLNGLSTPSNESRFVCIW